MTEKTKDIPALPSPPKPSTGITVLAAGFCSLIIAMGIGRFAYTVILPDMMRVYSFDEATAGIMAGWNYAGYLIGALVMRGEKPGLRRYLLLVFWLFLSLFTTACMGSTSSETAWHSIRFFSGLASGGIFVLASAIVFDALTATGKVVLAGFLYSGVGTGIALGGVFTPILVQYCNPDGAWFGLALLCLPLAAFTCFFLHPSRAPALPPATTMPSQTCQQNTNTTNKALRTAYICLLIIYFLEGFGYIIGTTFLVAVVHMTTKSAFLSGASWVITGCAAALTAPFWRLAAMRGGYTPVLSLAFTLQAIGMLLPVFSTSAAAGLGCGLLLGGTFMGITALSLQYGTTLSDKPSAHTIAIMTVIYGIGQIIGPFVAGFTASGSGGGFSFSFAAAAICLFTAPLFLWLGNRKGRSQ